MGIVQEYSTFIPTSFKDKNNEYDWPCPDSDDFLNHIKECSVDLNGHMKCRYPHW